MVKHLVGKISVLLAVALLSIPSFFVSGASSIIFSDNFETGNFSAWTSPVGNPRICTNPVRSGYYSSNFSFASSACYETKNIAPTNVLNYTYYVYFNMLPTKYTCQVLAQDTNGRQIYYRIENMNGYYYWSFSLANIQVTNSSTPSVLSGQWYKIQLLATAGNNCTIYFLVNDQMKATITNQTLSPINQLRIGNDWIDFGAYTPKGESYFDDVVATNSIINFISAYAEGNGTITPSGAISVPQNGNQTFTIKPNAHYHLVDVVVDDLSVGSVDNYTFYNVVGIHSIKAVFAIDTFAIASSAGLGGDIIPNGNVTVDYGGNQTFKITPMFGYHITDVKVNSSSVGAVNSYTFTNVQDPNSIVAIFDADPPAATNSPQQTSLATPAPTKNKVPTPTPSPRPTPSPSPLPPTETPVNTPTQRSQNTVNIDYTFVAIALAITVVIVASVLLSRRKNNEMQTTDMKIQKENGEVATLTHFH